MIEFGSIYHQYSFSDSPWHASQSHRCSLWQGFKTGLQNK